MLIDRYDPTTMPRLGHALKTDGAMSREVLVVGDKVLLVGGGRIDTRDRATGKRVSVSDPFRGPTDVVGLPGGEMIVSQASGEIRSNLDCEAEARFLLAAMRGLMIQYLMDRSTGDLARGKKILRAHCRGYRA